MSRRVRGRPGARLGVIGVGDSTLEKAVSGLLSCLKARPNDMELVAGIFATLSGTLIAVDKSKGGSGVDGKEDGGSDHGSNRSNSGEQWERDAARVALVWASMLGKTMGLSAPELLFSYLLRYACLPTPLCARSEGSAAAKEERRLFLDSEPHICVDDT